MSKKFKISIIVFAICLLSLICTIFWYFSTDFKKPNFESNAIKGIPFVKQKYQYDSLNVYKGFNIKIATNMVVEDGYAYIYFTSPKDNNVNLKLRIYDSNDKIVAESGLIKPGYYIEKLKLKRDISSEEQVKIKVMGYEDGTYYSAGSIYLNVNILSIKQ